MKPTISFFSFWNKTAVLTPNIFSTWSRNTFPSSKISVHFGSRTGIFPWCFELLVSYRIPLSIPWIPIGCACLFLHWNALLKKTQVITTRRWGGEVVLRKNTTSIGQWSCLWLPTECQATHKSHTYFVDKVNSPFHKKHTALRQILIFHTLYYQLDNKKKTQQQCFIPTVWGQLIYFHWDRSSIRAENINVRESIIYVYQ